MIEVCSQFNKIANLKSIVLLDHIFIDNIAIPMAPKNYYVIYDKVNAGKIASMVDTEFTIDPLGGCAYSGANLRYTRPSYFLEFKRYAMVEPLTFFFIILFFVRVQLL